ncbi:MAG: GntR family transcriptional regulator [Pseudomonadota bacterium]|nr:MAG: GntR family transcriptional regulator [Pseudomonadota bacterium]
MVEQIIRFDTKSRIAYGAIKTAIAEGRYLPGEKIGISQIARELSTSDIPVREAMQRLEAEGLLEYTPHVGFRVTSPDFGHYIHLFEVRQLLEGEAAKRAATRISANSLAELKRLDSEMATAMREGGMQSFSQLNRQFHTVLFEASENPVLIREIEHVGSIYPRTNAIFVMFPQRAQSTMREHALIIQCLESRDPAATNHAYLAHMAAGYEMLLRYRGEMSGEVGAQNLAINGISGGK